MFPGNQDEAGCCCCCCSHIQRALLVWTRGGNRTSYRRTYSQRLGRLHFTRGSILHVSVSFYTTQHARLSNSAPRVQLERNGVRAREVLYEYCSCVINRPVDCVDFQCGCGCGFSASLPRSKGQQLWLCSGAVDKHNGKVVRGSLHLKLAVQKYVGLYGKRRRYVPYIRVLHCMQI